MTLSNTRPVRKAVCVVLASFCASVATPPGTHHVRVYCITRPNVSPHTSYHSRSRSPVLNCARAAAGNELHRGGCSSDLHGGGCSSELHGDGCSSELHGGGL